MSVETSRVSQPGGGDSDDEQTFGYRSADSAAVDGDLDDDLDDDTVASRDDEKDDDSPVVYGTVVKEDAADPDAVVTDVDDPQPTFTPVDDGPVTTAPFTTTTYPSEPTLSETDDVPVIADQATTPVAEAPLSSATDIDPNAPLLGDPVGLRASWQQAQAGFVDDPRAAVADAAELVEHTAQTLIGSLQQRQRQLRTQWDNNGSAAGSTATAGELSDTEQLRHLMQDYRNLFNQLCQP
jgi:hypothetical protein